MNHSMNHSDSDKHLDDITMENQENGPNQDNGKSVEFIKDLLREKHSLDPIKHPVAIRLLEEEIMKVQTSGKVTRENKYYDIYRDRPIRVPVKVLLPVKDHPRFNFVGKLLGPKGNTLKRLQDDTMTKMAILGRGSMRDKQKEEECRNTLEPKYSHLSDELHVEITTMAAPAEAHARIAFALAELRKYLIPDLNDEIRQEQLREIKSVGAGRGPDRRLLPTPTVPPVRQPVARAGPPAQQRPVHGPPKVKVMSILDRARAALEEDPTGEEFEESGIYDPTSGHPAGFPPEYNGQGDFYNAGGFQNMGSNTTAPPAAGNRWKGFKSSISTRGYVAGSSRPAPYSRSHK